MPEYEKCICLFDLEELPFRHYLNGSSGYPENLNSLLAADEQSYEPQLRRNGV